MPRRFVVLWLVAVLVGLAAANAPTTLARLTGQGTSTYSMSTDTLAPPTGLAAGGPMTAALTWTASNDAYAAGYLSFLHMARPDVAAKIAGENPWLTRWRATKAG